MRERERVSVSVCVYVSPWENLGLHAGEGDEEGGEARGRALLLCPDKRLDRGMTFNGSQRWSCSATHDTPTQNQVVYESFSTGFDTNLRCAIGEGAALVRPHPGPFANGSARRGPPRGNSPATPDHPKIRGAAVSLRLGGILT